MKVGSGSTRKRRLFTTSPCDAELPSLITPYPCSEISQVLKIYQGEGPLTYVLENISTTGLLYSCPSPSSSPLLQLPETSFVIHHLFYQSLATISEMAKLFSLLTLVVAAAATPVVIPASKSAVVATRQLVFDRTSLTENEFSSILGGCKDVIFVWARGSTELGNMVSTLECDLYVSLTLSARALSSASHLATSSVVSMVAT